MIEPRDYFCSVLHSCWSVAYSVTSFMRHDEFLVAYPEVYAQINVCKQLTWQSSWQNHHLYPRRLLRLNGYVFFTEKKCHRLLIFTIYLTMTIFFISIMSFCQCNLSHLLNFTNIVLIWRQTIILKTSICLLKVGHTPSCRSARKDWFWLFCTNDLIDDFIVCFEHQCVRFKKQLNIW